MLELNVSLGGGWIYKTRIEEIHNDGGANSIEMEK
jgi:hypothetical protein